MKDSVEYTQRLKKLRRQLKQEGSDKIKMEEVDPTTALIFACLSEYATEKKARTALNKIKSSFVDYNELRVCRVDEVVEVLGRGFPQAKDVAGRIINLLKQVYNKEDSLDLSFLQEGSKREARNYLEKLKDSTAYVVGRVMLQSIGAHAFPVNQQMINMLRKEEVIHPEATEVEIQGFLERQISVRRVQNTYALLRQYADRLRGGRSRKKSSKTTTKGTKTTKKNKTK